MTNCLLTKNPHFGVLLLRISLAFLFLYAGLGKMFGSPFGGLGIEAFSQVVWNSMILAWVVAVIEVLGGLALLLGVWTRRFSALLLIIMIFAIVLVHNPIFGGAQIMEFFIRLVLIGALLHLIFGGSGNKAIKPD